MPFLFNGSFPGATPPWMVQDEYSSWNQQIGPSYEEFLKESKQTKSGMALGSLNLPTHKSIYLL